VNGVVCLTPTSEGPSIDSLSVGGTSRRFLEHLQSATEAFGNTSGLGMGASLGGLTSEGQPGTGAGLTPRSALAYQNLSIGPMSSDAKSPSSLFGGMAGTGMTPTGLSFGGLPSPSTLPADLGPMDLPSPVARALQAGARDLHGGGTLGETRLNRVERAPVPSFLGGGWGGGASARASVEEAGGGGGGWLDDVKRVKKDLSILIPENTLKAIEVKTGTLSELKAKTGAGGGGTGGVRQEAGGVAGPKADDVGVKKEPGPAGTMPSPGPLTSLLMQSGGGMALSGVGGMPSFVSPQSQLNGSFLSDSGKREAGAMHSNGGPDGDGDFSLPSFGGDEWPSPNALGMSGNFSSMYAGGRESGGKDDSAGDGTGNGQGGAGGHDREDGGDGGNDGVGDGGTKRSRSEMDADDDTPKTTRSTRSRRGE